MTNPAIKAARDAINDILRRDGIASLSMDLAEAAIAAYEKAMWRPIEEAPKDGTPIQVTHLPFTGRPPFNAVRWSHGPQKSQWRWRILGHERSPLRYTPTHFRPLPKPEDI